MNPAAEHVRVSRAQPPDWIARANAELAEGGQHSWGGQQEWHFTTPWLFRALASPTTNEPMLAAPPRSDLAGTGIGHIHRRAYWCNLLYLLIYRLGWDVPGAGVDAWLALGSPADDPTLRMIDAVWGADHALPKLLAWDGAWHSRGLGGRPCNDPDRPGFGQSHWRGSPNPLGHTYGPEGLHLEGAGGHLGTALHEDWVGDRRKIQTRLIRSDSHSGRAILITDSMIGWYTILRRLGDTLPSLANRSWRVEVVATPVGHLGTFRRSRATSLWFTGQHSMHVLGN